jgi:hypothetical protein
MIFGKATNIKRNFTYIVEAYITGYKLQLRDGLNFFGVKPRRAKSTLAQSSAQPHTWYSLLSLRSSCTSMCMSFVKKWCEKWCEK